MEQFKGYVIQHKIYIFLLTEANTKQITDITDRMNYHLQKFGRNTTAIYADSKSYNTTNSNWLQGGLMHIITEGVCSFYNK